MIDSFAPLTSASRLAHLSRSIPVGSVDSTASRTLALRAAGHLIAPPYFDELRRPANLALVTFNVIYPAAPACSRVDSLAPAHSGIRPAHSAALGAASELVVLVFEQRTKNGGQISTFDIVACPGRADSPFQAGA